MSPTEVLTDTPALANRLELLAQCSELLNEVRWSAPGMMSRVLEIRGRYPGGGDNFVSGGTTSDPTPTATDKTDLAAQAVVNFDHSLRRVHKDVLDLHRLWAANAAPRQGDRMADPGCELCTSLPPVLKDGKTQGYPMHYCESHTTIVVETITRKRKGGTIATANRYRVCQSCYGHWRRTGAIPDPYEVVAHVEGRRRDQVHQSPASR